MGRTRALGMAVFGGGDAHAPWWPLRPAPTREIVVAPRNQVIGSYKGPLSHCDMSKSRRGDDRRGVGHGRSTHRAPCGGPKLAAAIPHVLVRPMATTDRPEIDHPAILWSFGPLCPPNRHPPPPPWRRPQTHRARILPEGTATVTSRIRNLGMKTRRTSYRTALGSLKHFVSDIWPD